MDRNLNSLAENKDFLILLCSRKLNYTNSYFAIETGLNTQTLLADNMTPITARERVNFQVCGRHKNTMTRRNYSNATRWKKLPQKVVVLWLLFTVTATAQCVKGTTIVMHENKMGLFIGADSRAMESANSDSVESILPMPCCKIQVVGDSVAFFACGTFVVTFGYNGYAIIDSCLRVGDSPQKTQALLKERILSSEQLLTVLTRGDSARFRSIVEGKNLVAFMIVKRTGTTFTPYYIDFSARLISGRVFITADSAYENYETKVFGQMDLIFTSDFVVWGDTPAKIAKSIYRMIENQCSSPSRRSGKPIYILHWNRQGQMTWYGDKDPCFSPVSLH
jgi:hypothetical protein